MLCLPLRPIGKFNYGRTEIKGHMHMQIKNVAAN